MTDDHLVIFGSRSGVPESVVRAFVAGLPPDTVVITGGEFGRKGAPIESLTGWTGSRPVRRWSGACR